VITKPVILEALKELIAYEEGFRFQDLGVILAKKKCAELKANEPKPDLGLDAYAAGELFENGMGRGAACSNTATLTKIRSGIGTALLNFKDLKILFFVTPLLLGQLDAHEALKECLDRAPWNKFGRWISGSCGRC
jgi:hypothetical protein